MDGCSGDREAGSALVHVSWMPQGAVLLEAGAGRLQTALRAAPGATLADIACVLLDWLASALHPCYEGQTLPGMHDSTLAYCLWAGPHARLGMQDTLVYALRHSSTLCFCAGDSYVTVKAYWGVDATGMRDRVEVVGDKCNVDIGGFGDPPYTPTSVRLEDSRSGVRLAWACGGGHA